MKPPVPRKSFDRQDLFSRALQPEDKTGKHGLAVQENSTGATFSQLAAMLRSRVTEIFAQNFQQRLVRSKGDIGLLTVQSEPDLLRLLRLNRECCHFLTAFPPYCRDAPRVFRNLLGDSQRFCLGCKIPGRNWFGQQ